MLPQLISAALERALNGFLIQDPSAEQRLKPLNGKRLGLALRELPFELQIQFCSHQLLVMASEERHADATVQLSVLDLPRLTDGSALTALIKQERLALDGDAELLQQFARLLKETEVDVEELLSRYIGDIPAHQLGRAADKGRRYLQRQHREGKANLFEYLTDEVGLLPHPKMLEGFRREVNALAENAARMEQRLISLASLIEKKKLKGHRQQ